MTPSHPLDGFGLTVRNFKSFGDEGGSFGYIKPINVVIGRNNTGKSALIDAVEICISLGKSFDKAIHARATEPLRIEVSQSIDEASIRNVFHQNTSGGGVPGDHWNYGKRFIGQPLVREFGSDWKSRIIQGPAFEHIQEVTRHSYLEKFAKHATWPFDKMVLLRVAAERDVQPEVKNDELTLSANGRGTTNLIRAFINSVRLPRDEVEVGLLADLNEVYQGDATFTRIACQENDAGVWEIFLREEEKGDIRLSQSGSSLKSIFIILSLLRLVPRVKAVEWIKVVLAIEEPENNLHPALLRRLLNFLAKSRSEKRYTLITTTHSPVGIDWSSKRSDSQIVHVKHNGLAAHSQPAIDYVQGCNILDDLDVRASDILQANGVIWVEGPSDRIYLRRWIDLYTNDELKEGVHYTIMFYGGRLLSHLDALPPNESEELISLVRINRNGAILIDSDRNPSKFLKKKPPTRLNSTKIRIRKEIQDIGGFAWVTEGREIENYTPLSVFSRVVGKAAPKKLDQYTRLPDHPFLAQFRKDKVALAHAVAPATTVEDIRGHMDLWTQLGKLCDNIRYWNGSS